MSSRLKSIVFQSFSLRAQISLPYKRKGKASALYTFVLKDFWTKVFKKCCIKSPVFEKISPDFVEYFFFNFHRKFHDRDCIIQGVTEGTDQTSGECSLGHTIPI